MSSLKMPKYTPPDFRLFQQFERSLVYEADSAVSSMVSAYLEAQLRFSDRSKFVVWGTRIRGISENDLVDMYGQWAIADDLLSSFATMDLEDRKKHEALNATGNYKARPISEVEQRFADYSGKIAAWEVEAGKEYVYPVLNGQLKRRIDMWEEELDHAIGPGFADDVDSMTADEACLERTVMEYARSAIHILRNFEPITTVEGFERMEPLPYYDTYCTRVDALDGKFRQALKGHCYLVPWADPTFWWHWPESSTRTK